MSKVLSIDGLVSFRRKINNLGQSIVLIGGCFDVIHPGHIVFLEKAKKTADLLLIFLESDQKVRELKGKGRPVHSQKERAKILSAFWTVDYVVMLPFLHSAKDYDELIIKLKPDLIAGVADDPNNDYYRRSASLSGAKFQIVTKMIGSYSSTRILNKNEN